jgi:hypothetical protein
MARRAAEAPDAGFPQMVASDAELEGVYRFLSNEEVTSEAILSPHIAATLGRARELGECLVVHDTTLFEFGGDSKREGLGLMIGNGQGFLGHFALAVARGEARIPLGVCGLEQWRRSTRKGSNHSKTTWMAPDRESLRWSRMLEHVERLGRKHGFSSIHIMDREADIFDVLATAKRLGARFVIRAAQDRALNDEDGRVRERISKLTSVVEKRIDLSARSDFGRPGVVKKRHPKRAARTATIAIAGCEVELRPSAHSSERTPVRLNLVHVWEPSTPPGEPSVDWLLYTSEPAETGEELLDIVDAYRSRWVIEEYFKALKTGCAFEKRQLESYHALSNALAMFIPVAWRLLLARSICRVRPTAPASVILSDVQVRLLAHHPKTNIVPETARDATYAIAKLGGHLRRNGDPGWQTLARGFEALLLMQVGWRAAMAARCDQ